MKTSQLILIVIYLAIGSASYGQAVSADQELQAGLRAAEVYNWTAARPHFHRAQQLSRPSTRTGVLARIGLLRATMEQRNLAELTRTLAAMDKHPVVKRHADVRMWLYIAKGDCDNDLQFPEVARRDWQIVKDLATVTRNPKWSYRADGELSIPAYYLGDLATSRKLVGQALSAAKDAKDAASIIRLLTHIGSVYILRDQVEPGMEHLRNAEATALAAPETGYPLVVKEMQILGLTAAGKLAEAEALAGQIIARTKAVERRIHEAQTRLMLAAIYEKQNRVLAAIQELEVVIKMANIGNFYHQLSQAQIRLSNLYRQAGHLDRAAKYAAQALQSTHDSGIVSALPTHMQFLAGLRASQGRYTEADLLYRKAEDEVDAQLALTPSGAKHLLLKSTSDIYTEHFALVAEHMRSVAAAYRIVERVRGRILADLLRSGSLATGNLTAELEISALRLQLARATSPAEIARTRDAIFFARHKRWLADEPKTTAAVRRQAGRVLPVTTVQRQLDSSDVLIEYVFTAAKAYALVITKAKVRLADLGRRATIDTTAGRFIAAVRAKQPAVVEGDALARLVLGAIPEVRSHPNLIVVPDGQLYSVPFAALVLDGKRLIETHAVVRAPSASTYVMLRRKSARFAGGGLLAVGGVRYNADASRIAQQRGYKLDNLPGSRDEAIAASDVLAPFLQDRLLLEGSQATETAVKQALRTPRTLIHLAVHGIASDRPDRGALVFLPDASSTEDGLLEVPEIVQLRLSSDLAVLSACDTAVGQVQGQEGVASLSRAFLLGGSRSVVSTLWAIDDAFSATLMRSFYLSLVKGMSKSTALVMAQRYIVQRFPSTAVPWYWAGYMLDGDGGASLPIEGQRSRNANDKKRVER
jgi:CHAT domain-containing protein/tetratricopeptide (TPR) repeat protein